MAEVLYLGDGKVRGPARYLCAILTRAGLRFVHKPPNKKPNERELIEAKLVILSDYPRANLDARAQRMIKEKVTGGGSLLMVGGWESFSGAKKEYFGTEIEELLPVKCLNRDDRLNHCSGLLVTKSAKHKVLEGLRFEEAPVICGLNVVKPKKRATIVLTARKIMTGGKKIRFGSTFPLLVLGTYEKGKVAALTTDLAPHWVGGLVDWGEKRLKIDVEGDEVEVGENYFRMVSNIFSWLMNRLT